MSSYITDEEMTIISLTLPDDPPPVIAHVSEGMLSVSRHYGGCTYQSQLYTYFPATDELIRMDVLKLVSAQRKLAAKAARTTEKEAAKAAQGDLL